MLLQLPSHPLIRVLKKSQPVVVSKTYGPGAERNGLDPVSRVPGFPSTPSL